MDEELAARRLSAAKARLILAESSNNPSEFVAALRCVENAENAYREAVNQ